LRDALGLFGRAVFFEDKEIGLLEEAAANVSFGLITRADEAPPPAGKDAPQRKRILRRMIESMPGILYIYDATGVSCVGRSFETVSGYSPRKSPHAPARFLLGEEQPLVEERIGEVFAKESRLRSFVL